MMKRPILLALGTALLLQAQAMRTCAAKASDLLKEGCLFSYLPDDNRFYAKIEFTEKWLHSPEAVALGKQCTSAAIRVTRSGKSTPLLEHSLSITDGVSSEVQLALPPLTGKCEVRFELSGLPEVCTVTKSFERLRFAWEGNHLGITTEIYPPYEPVRVEGKTVLVVSRRYTMNGFGLWDEIMTLDRNILAAPIQIRYTTAVGEGVWSGACVALDSESCTPQQAVFTATATSRAVQVTDQSLA